MIEYYCCEKDDNKNARLLININQLICAKFNQSRINTVENVLTFIIPVRHPENARDWKELKSYLGVTLQSIANQDQAGWRAIIVANYGSDLPALPPGVEVKWVDFPPNQLHEQGTAHREQFHEAVRLDKGRRILAGLLEAGLSEYCMVVDDDDLISNGLTGFVKRHRGANGWFIRHGYVWTPGNKLLYRYPDFSMLCGTSHIVRTDLFALPAREELATDDYIKQMLGSHIFITRYLREQGTPLAPLPFTGAIYRTGHAGSHSRSRDVLSTHLLHAWLLKSPGELARRLCRFRLLGAGIQREFFGPQQGLVLVAQQESAGVLCENELLQPGGDRVA